jgi:hypothetical protein
MAVMSIILFPWSSDGWLRSERVLAYTRSAQLRGALPPNP